MSNFDPKLPKNKTAAMSLVLQHTARGYRYWTGGQITAAKASRFATKFDAAYGVGRTPQQRAYYRARGLAASALIILPRPKQPVADWVLLVTPGTSSATQLESLRDCAEQAGRLQFAGYELVQQPGDGGKMRWTWRRPKLEMESWYALIDQQTRAAEHWKLQSSLQALAKSPGFAGVRTQTLRLFAYAKEHCQTGITTPFVNWTQFPNIYADPPLRLSQWVESQQTSANSFQ